MTTTKGNQGIKAFLLSFTIFISACGGGSSSDSGDPPTGVIPPEPPPPVTKTELTPPEAAAFLNRATFGATRASIDDLVNSNVEDWLEAQRAQTSTRLLPYIQSLPNQDEIYVGERVEGWFQNSVRARDQLRQRMAFALSQIFVVSDTNGFLSINQDGMANYYDMLLRNSFGNFRDLLEEVTLNPVMGFYLSTLGNQKPDVANNIRPDENYAREIMQLFTIGLIELNLDGTPVLDGNGNTIPTYDQDTIEAFSHVYTGWSFADNQFFWQFNVNLIDPMKAFEEYHDRDEKVVFDDVVIPAGQTAQQDIDSAMDILFNHQNVAPFIGKQLIQRFVTSNPSPEYVSRVASAFNDNGEGVRGDLWAVLVAVLTDDEAYRGAELFPGTFGKLREPLIRTTHLMRILGIQSQDGNIPFGYPDFVFGQSPQHAPSVFNFYFPSYQPPGELSDLGLVGPEFQIATANNLTGMHNSILYLTFFTNDETGEIGEDDFLVTNTEWITLADNHTALVDELDLVFTAGQMTDEMKTLIVNYLNDNAGFMGGRQKLFEAMLFVLSSSEFAIQK